MLSLNIIPLELKRENKLKNLSRSINVAVAVITMSVFTYTVIIVGCRFFLNNYYQEISSQNVLVTKNTDNYSKQIKEINKQIASIETAQKDSIAWPPLLAAVFNNVPNDIKLNSITFNKIDNKLNINGVAGTRTSLIELREFLENNKNFSVISFPVQSLIEKQNINFDIVLTINSYVPQS